MLNKSRMIELYRDQFGVQKQDAEAVIDWVFEVMQAELVTGDGSVIIRSFGSFSLKRRAARMGKNPRTGEPIPIAAKTVPVFKAGRELMAQINGG